MKKYLLFAFGNFTDLTICENLIETVSSVTHSDFVKFKQTNTYIYFNFETQKPYDELVKYFHSTFGNVTECHILTEYTDKTSVIMNEIDSKEFNNLKASKRDEEILQKLNSELTNMLFEQLFDESLNACGETWLELDDCDDDDESYKIPKKHYNVDQLLDKIKSKGRSSLTKKELEFLKTV
jgi:hypothetical protein